MNLFRLLTLAVSVSPWLAASAQAPPFHAWAERPLMGWNSWDFYGTTVTEAQTKAQADYMDANLKAHGWNLITVDIQWYCPDPIGAAAANGSGWYHGYYTPNADLEMDGHGRLVPPATRFPSVSDSVGADNGFQDLADYLHAKGLKFGIHIMRGIPRQAVVDNLPILGTPYTAADIADTSSTCEWNGDMYGVNMDHPGGQAYYDSIFALYASWGVDLVKVDDLSRPYHLKEIEGIRQAIDNCGRDIVLSTSPGQTPVAQGKHVMNHANQWRVMDDFWDNWGQLYDEFGILDRWTPYRGPGHFPDADMIPFGQIEANAGDTDGRPTNFTQDEQYLLMSLWAIVRSPLIHGGDMTQMDPFTLSLFTNDEVIAVNQHSLHNRQLFRSGDLIAWVADDELSSDKYLAVFNTGGSAANVPVTLADLGFSGTVQVRSLWDQTDLGGFTGSFSPSVNSHGGALYKLSGTLLATPWITDAVSGDTEVTLSWETLPGADSYRVKRADGASGVYTVVADNVLTTSITDTGLTNGTVYHYKVSAMVSAVETPDSGERSVVPMGQRVVSWNLNAFSDSPTGTVPTAGAYPAGSWNDSFLLRHVSPESNLWDCTGELAPITLAWSSVNTYSITGSHPGEDADGTYNREVLNGYLNAGGGATSSVTLSNVGYSSYDVYVYFSSDTAGRQGTVTDGTTTYHFNTVGGPSVSGSNAVLTPTSNTTPGDYSVAANYAVFSGLSGSTRTFTVDIPNWGGIAAVQVVSDGLPTPVFFLQPADTSVPEGADVTLTADATTIGTATYQWFKDGSPLTGETTNTLTLTNVGTGDAGDYFLRVHDDSEAGLFSDSNVATVTVYPASPGGMISFNIDVNGTINTVNGSGQSGAGDIAGVVPVGHWTGSWNGGGQNYGPTDLIDSNGNPTPVDISGAGVNDYSIGGTPGQDADTTWNRNLLNGYMNAGGGATSSFTVSEIPYASYDIYVYFSSDTADREGSVTDGATTYFFRTVGPASTSGADASFIQTLDTTDDATDDLGNYAVFSGLSGATQTITADINNWGGLAGIQIVDTTPVAPGDTFADWIGGYPGVGGLTGFDDDADGDGLSNGVENFLGTDPSVFNQSLTNSAKSGSTFTFEHPQNAMPASDVAAAYRWSPDLMNWYDDGASDGPSTVSFAPSTVGSITTVTATIDGSIPARLFVELEAIQTP